MTGTQRKSAPGRRLSQGAQVTYVIGIEEIKEKSIVVKRRLEDGYERVECDLPALLTVIGR